jgi:nicotinic acid phosphoribosyltransferase
MTTYTPDPATGILFTDQYQLTMAQLYFDRGLHERTAQFDMFFRRYPDYGRHQAGYCISAGLEPLLEWMEEAAFTAHDLDALARHENRDGTPRFGRSFLEWLEAHGDFSAVALRAIPEGRVVHPHAPMVVARGPLAMAQVLETALLNHLNYPTLIATKASRIREAGRGRPVLEFGLRRGPMWGANAGARAALIGGCDFTSNVGTSTAMGVDPKGTHAHSMVQVFMALGGGELEAFRAYAGLYPDDCILLVDTIDTIDSGVPNAIMVFRELRNAGHEPVGVRLDSGDLAFLSIQAARLLDERRRAEELHANEIAPQQLLSSFAESSGALAAILMARDGSLVASVNPDEGLDMAALGAGLATLVDDVNKLGNDQGCNTLGGFFIEYDRFQLFCLPLAEDVLVVVAPERAQLGVIRHKTQHLADALTEVLPGPTGEQP